MSIQWTLVAGFLYVEIAAVVLLLLPFLRPRTWQKFFKSRFLRSIESQANLYFMVFIVILVLLFLGEYLLKNVEAVIIYPTFHSTRLINLSPINILSTAFGLFLLLLIDSMREMTKYSGDLNTDHGGNRHVDAELQHSMKLFRAQRNFYIAGFALFLFLVIRRLVTLLTALAQLDIQVEVTMKQAKSASDAAKSLMSTDKSTGGDKGAENKEITKLKELLKTKEKELVFAKLNEESMKKQSKNLADEYDRLMAEHQEMLKKHTADGGNKKDN